MSSTEAPVRRVDPVFVIGSPRSGTSAFAWALAQHPGLSTGPESDFLYYLLKGGANSPLQRSYLQALETPAGLKGRWLKTHDVDWDEFAAHAGLGFAALFASRSAGQRWVDSSPSNTLVVDDLLRMFPGARFIHVLRDGRAVVNSMIASSFPVQFASSFSNACETWAAYARRARAFCLAHPECSCEARNEEWTADAEEVLRRTSSSLGLDFDSRCVTFLGSKRINSSFQAGAGDTAPTGGDAAAGTKAPPWANWTSRQQRTFRELAAPTMAQLGYDHSLD